MATFTQLQSRLREDILAEDSTAFFSDADLLGFLTEANAELGSLGNLVVESEIVAVSSSSVIVNLTGTLPILDVMDVLWAGYPLQRVDFLDHYFYDNLESAGPRYYFYDPKRISAADATKTVLISPKTTLATNAAVRYSVALSSKTYSGSDAVWEGRLPDWHDTVLYLAGVKAFERSQEYEMAQYWNQRLEKRLQTLAIFLDDSSVLSVVRSQS